MKLLQNSKKRNAGLALLGAMLLPLILGGGSASAAIKKATGTSHGLQLRDAKSTFPGSSTNNGTCLNAPPGAPGVSGLASYQYPFVTPDFINPVPQQADGQTTPTVGSATIEGVDSTGTSRTYTGPIQVRWAASTVWDGPHGTTQALNGTAATCLYGYRWPVTSASIIGEVGSISVPATYQKISCTAATVGSGAAADGLGVASGSYYSRPLVSPTNPLLGEVIVLEFASTNCTIQLGTVVRTLSGTWGGSSVNRFTLQDRGHAFCGDFNVVEGAIQTGEPTNEVGVTHCASNYEIRQ